MPRKPLADEPMTSAERVRKHRNKFKTGTTAQIEKFIETSSKLKIRNEFIKLIEKNHELEKETESAIDSAMNYISAYYKEELAQADIRLNEHIDMIIRLNEEHEAELDKAYAENKLLRDQIKKLGSAIPKIEGKQILTPKEIKLLKQLCHPDKHGGSDAAHKASTLLNKL